MLKGACVAVTTALGLIAAPVPAFAQEQLTPQTFLDQAVGNTLTFEGFRSGRIVGEEQFLRKDLSVWTDPRGRCTYGTIEIRGSQLCFIYDDDPDPTNCWLVFQFEGDLLVMSDNEIQKVSRIEKRNINCDGAPLS